jgi:hypothetical protein
MSEATILTTTASVVTEQDKGRCAQATGSVTPPTFIAWQCEKCGRYHSEYWPKDGCDWCRGDAIAMRLGLTAPNDQAHPTADE